MSWVQPASQLPRQAPGDRPPWAGGELRFLFFGASVGRDGCGCAVGTSKVHFPDSPLVESPAGEAMPSGGSRIQSLPWGILVLWGHRLYPQMVSLSSQLTSHVRALGSSQPKGHLGSDSMNPGRRQNRITARVLPAISQSSPGRKGDLLPAHSTTCRRVSPAEPLSARQPLSWTEQKSGPESGCFGGRWARPGTRLQGCPFLRSQAEHA